MGWAASGAPVCAVARANSHCLVDGCLQLDLWRQHHSGFMGQQHGVLLQAAVRRRRHPGNTRWQHRAAGRSSAAAAAARASRVPNSPALLVRTAPSRTRQAPCGFCLRCRGSVSAPPAESRSRSRLHTQQHVLSGTCTGGAGAGGGSRRSAACLPRCTARNPSEPSLLALRVHDDRLAVGVKVADARGAQRVVEGARAGHHSDCARVV